MLLLQWSQTLSLHLTFAFRLGIGGHVRLEMYLACSFGASANYQSSLFANLNLSCYFCILVLHTRLSFNAVGFDIFVLEIHGMSHTHCRTPWRT